MELAVLALLAVLAIPVGLIWLAVSHSRLKDRVTRLEADLARLSTAPVPVPVPVPLAEVAPLPPVAVPLPVVEETPPPASPPPAPLPPLPAPAPDAFDRLGVWLRENWVNVVAALSLAAAGVFLVQYGVEKGLLPPGLRVLAGVGFGLVLIAAGQGIRRRWGDGAEGGAAYLPSVFSGAGLVSVFAAVLAGRLLYGLISAEVTFAGLVATALAAVLLGWLHGPLLAALGLVGAAVAPFLTGGGSTAPAWLMAHYVIVAALGLGIDTLRRWGWVSVLALVLAVGGGALLMQVGAGEAAFLLLLVALVLLAIAIPARSIQPDQGPPSLLAVLLSGGKLRLAFPMQLALGATAAAGVALAVLPLPDTGTVLLAFGLAAGLVVAILLWADRAPALHDLALIPALAFLSRLLAEAVSPGPLWHAFVQATPALRGPEVAAPLTLTGLMALAGLIALALSLRAGRGTGHPVWLAGAGAALLPLAMMTAEVFWTPSAVLGAYPWALHVIAGAAVMVALAAMAGRQEVDPPRRRTAHAVLSALVLIALALFVLTTKAALSLALAVLVVVAALLDRRFRLPELSFAVMAGVAVIGYRLTFDPGLFWALEAPLTPVILSHLGPVAGFLAALWALHGMDRPGARAFLDTGALAVLALLADVLLLRWLDDGAWFVLMSTLGLPWLVLALVLLARVQRLPGLRLLRIVVAAVAGAVALLALIAAIGFNPILGAELVRGPRILDTLFVAYGLPALLLVLAAVPATVLPPRTRPFVGGAGAILAAIYVGLEIRRFWQGDDLSAPGTTQPELYTYTVVLLILGAVLLWRAIATGSQRLRRGSMAVIALASAKVFLIDAGGLTGLMRVFSFLALGLSLAGLAALNRWAAARSGPDRTPPL